MRKLLLAGIFALACSPSWAQNCVPTQGGFIPCGTNLATTITTVVIAAGNTFQSVLAATVVNSQTRHSITIQNNNTNTDNCWVFLGPNGSATKATSILLGPGGSYQRYAPFLPAENISATCTTTNDTIYLDVQ